MTPLILAFFDDQPLGIEYNETHLLGLSEKDFYRAFDDLAQDEQKNTGLLKGSATRYYDDNFYFQETFDQGELKLVTVGVQDDLGLMMPVFTIRAEDESSGIFFNSNGDIVGNASYESDNPFLINVDFDKDGFSLTRRDYVMLSLTENDILSFDWGVVESSESNQMAVEVEITDRLMNGERNSSVKFELDETQRSILNNFNIDYPFMAEAFAADVNQNNNATSSSDYLPQNAKLYNRLTDAEKAFVRNPANLLITPKFFEDFQYSINRSAVVYSSNPSSLHNGEGDAFRHALWSALMTQHGGIAKAHDFGNAHEEDPGQPAIEKEMDLQNNRVGREIALSNPNSTPAQLEDLIKQAVRDGSLKFYDQSNN